MLSLVLLALVLPCPQDEPATADPSPAARAQALLERAARFQTETPRSRPPASLHGTFYGTILLKDQGTANLNVERWYTRSPERLLTRQVESITGSQQTLGDDGRRAWFRDDRTGEVVVYSDDPELWAVDLELLDEQRRLTRMLLESVVLDALIPRLGDVRVGPAGTHRDVEGVEHPVRHVHATLVDDLYPPPRNAPPPGPGSPPRRLVLDFVLDSASGKLWALKVQPLGRSDVSALELHFDYHDRTPSGLVVPGNVRVFRAGTSEELARLGVAYGDDDRLAFDVDVEIDPEIFSPSR